MISAHAREVESGRRFEFGRNWSSFLHTLTAERIARAEGSLAALLDCTDLAGRAFLDLGSGSGLFSLAARRMGARVVSVDYDPQSVACTAELRARRDAHDPHWQVLPGSVLDRSFVTSLGSFDVVYSWGVLHHTGELWTALANALRPVAHGGVLVVALYNDQGLRSRLWRGVKRAYCAGGPARGAVLALLVPALWARAVAAGLIRHRDPRAAFRQYQERRGMSLFHDWIDWLGGYPFEVARPGAVTAFCASRGFRLRREIRTRSFGCNQFVFERRV